VTERRQVIVVDDKLAMAETLADGLADHGYAATALGSGRAALAALRNADLVITDLRMPDVDGMALLEAGRAADVPVIVMTAFGAIDSAVEAIRRGAYHYVTKPFKLDELVVFVERALAERALRHEAVRLRRTLGEDGSLGNIVARSAAMQRVVALVERVAPSDVPILLVGETGAGKGLLARAIHARSPRAHAPLIAVNCAALPDALLESELFGHAKGAFTGATADHAGLFAEADGGTLLLDEIGEMSSTLQAKLLHVLESKRVRPVGATRDRAVDVRVVSATHRDLARHIADGTFREDLRYRLDGITIELPALRHRRDDLPALVERFLADARARQPKSPARSVSRDAMHRLLDHPWPGNVRELAHVVERAVLLATDAEIGVDELVGLASPPRARDGAVELTGDVEPMIAIQRRYARWALDQLGGHKTRTAERLDVDVKTLNRWLSEPKE
jgi:two-component system response regulator HydG